MIKIIIPDNKKGFSESNKLLLFILLFCCLVFSACAFYLHTPGFLMFPVMLIILMIGASGKIASRIELDETAQKVIVHYRQAYRNRVLEQPIRNVNMEPGELAPGKRSGPRLQLVLLCDNKKMITMVESDPDFTRKDMEEIFSEFQRLKNK